SITLWPPLRLHLHREPQQRMRSPAKLSWPGAGHARCRSQQVPTVSGSTVPACAPSELRRGTMGAPRPTWHELWGQPSLYPVCPTPDGPRELPTILVPSPGGDLAHPS
ncbi:hypothetical protein H8959_010920, partial [Pygathrix nigripes]